MLSRLILFALSGFLAASSVPGRQGPDGGQYTIAVAVDLVVFNVMVADNRGRHVSALKPDDFRVYEEGGLQEITLFKAEDVPASVGLIVDNSGSMADKRADVVNAALTFAGAGNSADELFVVNFNEKAYLGLPPSIRFTSDPDQIRSALTRTTPAGLTALYDALAVGIEYLKTGARDRKALVLLSDGGDNASRRRLDEVLQIAQRSSATIYAIGIYDDNDPDRNPGVLRKIAALSGGRAYFPHSLRIGVSVMVLEGVESDTLRVAAGHVPETPMPGAHGNVGIAAHRDTFFRNLQGIQTDDRIHVSTLRGTYEYVVYSVEIVGPDDTQVLRPEAEGELTLITCYPFYFIGSAPKRFIVHARTLVS